MMNFLVHLLLLAPHDLLSTAVVLPPSHMAVHDSIQQRLVRHTHSSLATMVTDERPNIFGIAADEAQTAETDDATSSHQLAGLISTLTEEFRGLDFGALFWSNADGIVSLELSCVPSFPDSGGKDVVVTTPLGQWNTEGITSQLCAADRETNTDPVPNLSHVYAARIVSVSSRGGERLYDIVDHPQAQSVSCRILFQESGAVEAAWGFHRGAPTVFLSALDGRVMFSGSVKRIVDGGGTVAGVKCTLREDGEL